MHLDEFEKYLKEKYPRTSTFLCGLVLFFIDAFILLLSISLGFFIVNIFAKNNINFKSFVNYSVFIPFILFLYGAVGLYPGIMIPPTEEVKNFCFCTFFGFLAIVLSIFISEFQDFSVTKKIIQDSTNISVAIAFLISTPISMILLPGFREIARRVFSIFKWWGVPCVVYCTDNSATIIIDRLLENKYLGYHPAVIIESNHTENDDNNFYKGIPIFSSKDTHVLDIIKKVNIKTAIICDYHDSFTPIMTSYRYTITVSKRQSTFTYTQQLKDIAGIIAFSSTHNLTFKRNILYKRAIDILIILFFAPFIIPIMLVLALLVKLTSKGPVFYGHRRVGRNGKEFKCWKFRTMCVNSQEILKHILETDPVMRAEWEKDHKFLHDPRVTKFGKFLRKTSLDELPQLFNIFIGEMSFIGPRPVTEEELIKYGKYKDYVLSVLPGLSGMWQISGRSDTGYEERVSYDTYYIQNWSIWLDIWILIKTVWVVLNSKGAY